MSWFNSLKSIGSKIFNGVKSAGSKVLNWANSARDGVKRAYKFSQKVPIIGDIVKNFINKSIPQIGGQSLGSLADKANSYLDEANNISDQLQAE